jgi:hypothetical protein
MLSWRQIADFIKALFGTIIGNMVRQAAPYAMMVGKATPLTCV